jgi:hypothetical protein
MDLFASPRTTAIDGKGVAEAGEDDGAVYVKGATEAGRTTETDGKVALAVSLASVALELPMVDGIKREDTDGGRTLNLG